MDIEILHTYWDSSCYEIYYKMDGEIYGYIASHDDWEHFWKGDREFDEDSAYIFLTLENFENAKDGNGPFETLEEAIQNA